YKKPEYAVVDVSGLGYRVNISLKTYDKLIVGEENRIYIYNFIKEDAFKLIGFLKESERTVFELLLSVSGIGVSLALSILSSFEIGEIRKIVSEEDYLKLKKVPKLGEKKSKQIILDLKSKLELLNIIAMEENSEEIDSSAIIEEELFLALESLGYSKKEIDNLVSKKEMKEFKSIEEAIKAVLKKIREKK
ncbi:MAG: Holliday junction branch migration protein RuvA, partial [Fusobacteriaceae bacterium]